MHVGIDFGTTNSSLGRRTTEGVELVRFAGGTASSRSILYLERTRQGVRSRTGAEAIAGYLESHAEGLAAGRLIQSLKSYLPVRSLTTTEIFGRPYTLEDLISRIVGDLRLAAERQFGAEIRTATVGRPVRFVGAETAEDEAFALERLQSAFARAGFEAVRFELEPLAAAAAYQATLDHVETILIGDFGGGTSDFSLVEAGPNGHRRVLGNAGLGFAGDAFDARVIRRLVAPALGSETMARGTQSVPAVPAWIYANLERWHYLSFLRTRNVLELLTVAEKRAEQPERIAALRMLIDEDLGYQLHGAVQRAKTQLSAEREALFRFDGPDSGSFAYVDPPLRAMVRRQDFEGWIAPELVRIAATVEALLVEAGVAAEAVDRVFLTGGTSFVPAVRAIFAGRFGQRVVTGDAFTSVAQGLALLGAE